MKRQLLEQVASTGSPVDMRVVTDENRQTLEIREADSSHDSEIFELEDGRFGFISNLVPTNQTRRVIYLADVIFRSALIDDSFRWLESQEFRFDKARVEANHCACRFPGG